MKEMAKVLYGSKMLCHLSEKCNKSDWKPNQSIFLRTEIHVYVNKFLIKWATKDAIQDEEKNMK